MKKTVAFIGLGVMGAPMARHLAAAGFAVRGFNRSPEKNLRWANACNGVATKSLRECTAGADAVITCVGNDDDLRQTLLSDPAILGGLAPNTVVIDHSTVSLKVSREAAEACAPLALHFVDAPVSGGQQGAENGQLSIMAGGTSAALQAAEQYMQTYAKSVVHIGGSGSGQLCKMANQIAAAGVLQGLAEAMHFAEQAGLDLAKVVQAISGGAAGSWQMSNRADTMIAGNYDFGFAVDWMVKDLGIACDTAETVSANISLTKSILLAYQELQTMGGGRWDTSSLFKRLQAKT